MRSPGLLAALVILAAACEDPTETARADSLGFTFAGDLAGEFMAVGLPPAARDPLPAADYAFAVTQPNGRLGLVARLSTGPATGHLIRLANIPAAVGSFPVGGLLTGRFEVNRDETGPADPPYRFTDGTVTITAIAGGRVRGAFYGTATQTDPRSRGLLAPGRPIAITGGVFNLMVDAPAASAYGCLVTGC